jgi:hypothetical protein
MATHHLQYIGFRTGETTRDYRLLASHGDGQCYEFTFAVEQAAFLAGRVRYQDAAEICFWKLERALVSWDLAPASAPPASRQTVTEADLREYRETHTVKPRRLLSS